MTPMLTTDWPAHPDVQWRTSVEERDAARYDRSGWTPDVDPAVVAVPRTVEGVRHVLAVAHAGHVPVVPRGAGSGLAGAATALRSGIVLDLTGLNRIIEISAEDEIAVVEPGVITADLDRAARTYGLRYAPDPASVEISTIGGNIATNAGGLRCAKYGVTRDAVLGLDVVLADGRLITTGRRTVKGVAGYDLTSLFVGSEGTLGMIVGATLRLRPEPVSIATVAAFFPDAASAFAAVANIRARGVVPAVAEFVDGATLGRIDDHLGTDLRTRGDAFLLLQTDGAGAALEAEMAADALRVSATRIDLSTDPEDAARLTAIRRAALPALERLGRVVIEDIGVPRSRMAEAVRSVQQISAATGVSIYTFAHAGDGNLHPIIVLCDGQNPSDPEVIAAADGIFGTALRLGGTVTGEHGVGVLKRDWMRRELDPEVQRLQGEIKAVFDPTGILNPDRAI